MTKINGTQRTHAKCKLLPTFDYKGVSSIVLNGHSFRYHPIFDARRSPEVQDAANVPLELLALRPGPRASATQLSSTERRTVHSSSSVNSRGRCSRNRYPRKGELDLWWWWSRWRLGGRSYYKNVDSYTDTFAYNHTVESSGRWTVPY